MLNLTINSSVMHVVQERLDVKIKKRSNLFNWRGQFTPEFVEYMLEMFANPDSNVLDPFSGSGTVLQECARMNLRACGFEINPSAYAMSRFFSFCNISLNDRLIFVNEFERKLNRVELYNSLQPVFIENPDYRKAYKNLLNFTDQFNIGITSKNERIFLLNVLFACERNKSLSLESSLHKSFTYNKKALLTLPFTAKPIIARLKDARVTGSEYPNTFDLIITSPPYINVFNYHQNFRAIIEKFKFDILKVAQSEFGSNRKNRGNRFKTVIQYSLDMEEAIHSFWNSLKPNGKMVLVVGRESNVRNTAFYNSKLIIDIINESKGFREINILERQFINKFGNNIKEDIIIAKKAETILTELFGRKIALNQLENCLRITSNSIHDDVVDAINQLNNIESSPIFTPNNIFSNE